MIEFNNVNNYALKNLEFTINSGEFVFLVGSSGSGKTSVLKMLLREIEPTNWSISVRNARIDKIKEKYMPLYRRTLGVVFQDFRLLPNKTVYQNIEYALRVVGKDNEMAKEKILNLLDEVGLTNKQNAYPHELSGGEQQRVALARAIINKPQILLADEPTGNLDPITAKEIVDLLIKINEKGTTVLMATHDVNIVNSLKKRVITLKHGEIISDNCGGEYKIEL